MVKRADAKRDVIEEWRGWGEKSIPPTDSDKFSFYTWLRENKPHLLEFRYGGDKWQIVHSWLNEAERHRVQ